MTKYNFATGKYEAVDANGNFITADSAAGVPTSYTEAAGLGPTTTPIAQGVGIDADKYGWTSMSGLGGLALGGAQLGVGLLGTLDAMKTAKEQRKLLGQQYDTNVEKMAAWREGIDNVKTAFGSGLAARGVV